MTLFDLLLILLVLGTAAEVLAALIALALHRWTLFRRLALFIILVWILYLGVGAAVAIATPQHIMALGQDRCFDEMCFAVTGWNRTPSTNPGMSFYTVDVRITNRSQGHAQREAGRKGVLIDRAGRAYDVSPAGMRAKSPTGGWPGLDAEVGAGQSLATTLVFELPEGVDSPGFALGSDLALNPARLVIGDEDHFLHWPTVVPLD